MQAKRTDLAMEARELWQEGAEKVSALQGVRSRSITVQNCPVTEVEILDARGAAALGKPEGRYFHTDLTSCLHARDFDRAVNVVSEQLRRLLPPQGSLLVAGLGNAAMTPDAVGPLALTHLLVTRHLITSLPEHFGSFRSVAAIAPGVLGTTGMESAEAVEAAARTLRPDAVIVIDALAARKSERLCTGVQLSDSGIVPGSGVGNHRRPLNRETLGVSVIALGVPTVVDAATLSADLLEKNGITDFDRESLRLGHDVFVTPRDIDAQVRQMGKILGYAITRAAQGLEVADITALLS